jgi:hypothetical protein
MKRLRLHVDGHSFRDRVVTFTMASPRKQDPENWPKGSFDFGQKLARLQFCFWAKRAVLGRAGEGLVSIFGHQAGLSSAILNSDHWYR